MNHPHPETDLRILATFVDWFAAPAEGHAREELTAEQEQQLRKLAAGELGAVERGALVPFLLRNETAMEFLVEAAG